MCNNSTGVAYVNKQRGTVSNSLCSLAGQPLRWTESHNVHLEARYLPRQSSVLGNLLSRQNQVLGAEWSLHLQVARKLIRTWGSPLLDLFATHLNAKLPLYCSLIPDPQAAFEDAFRHPWNDLDACAFPLFHLVERVMARVRETPKLSMTLVTPLWPEKAWFADLLLLTQPPLALPLWNRLLRQLHFSRFYGGVHALNLHAWRLLSASSESQALREELLSRCPAASESTARLYQSQWLSFCSGCRGRGVAPIDATIPLIVDFLIHLRVDKGFSLSALKGYRSTINSVMALKGVDLATSRELSMLFRSFSRSFPTTYAPQYGMWHWSSKA